MTTPIPPSNLGDSIQSAVDAADLLAKYDSRTLEERTGFQGQAMLAEVQARALTSIAQSLAYMTMPAFGHEVLRP